MFWLQPFDEAEAEPGAPSRLGTAPSTDGHRTRLQDTEAGVLVRARRLTPVFTDEQWAAAAAFDSTFEADGAVVEIGRVAAPSRYDTSFVVVRYTEAGAWERAPASAWDPARPAAGCDYPDRPGEVGPEPDRDGRGRPVPPGVWGRYVLDEAPSPDGRQTAWLTAADGVAAGLVQPPRHVGPFALTVVGDSARVFHIPMDPLYVCWSPSGAFAVVVGGDMAGAWAAASAR